MILLALTLIATLGVFNMQKSEPVELDATELYQFKV
jgi:hypothetical protein